MIRQMMKKTLLFLCVFMLGATGALAAYPDHPITLVVPFGAGGGTDIPARLLAGMMEKRLGQPIVVQNVSGAGGTLGGPPPNRTATRSAMCPPGPCVCSRM